VVTAAGYGRWTITGAPLFSGDTLLLAVQMRATFYVAHVLPKEWAPSWDADALGAFAIAAKSYGAYRAMSGHARTGGTGCYDILDTTADQVFDPTYSTAATDQAVYATFGSIALRFGALFLSNYFSGSPSDPYAAVTGQYAGWMSQWGTQTCGTESVLWPGRSRASRRRRRVGLPLVERKGGL
jgi:hypothetical protein